MYNKYNETDKGAINVMNYVLFKGYTASLREDCYTRDVDPVSVDLLDMNDGTFLLFDNDARSQTYHVKADSAEQAVKSYINYLYGKVRIGVWDEEEEGWTEGEEFTDCANLYEIEEASAFYEVIEE